MPLEKLTALAPFIGAGVQAGSGIAGQLLANKSNRELAKYQNQESLRRWQLQNEYNLPSAQMQRLRDAGINPHMAYAKGTINNVASATPQAQRAEMKNVAQNMPQLGQFLLQAPLIREQTESIRLDNKKKKIDLGEEGTHGEAVTIEMADGTIRVEKKALGPYQQRLTTEINKLEESYTQQKLQRKTEEMRARLAEINMTVNDDALLRQMALVVDKENMPIWSITILGAEKILKQLGYIVPKLSKYSRGTGGMPVNAKDVQTTRWKSGQVTRTKYK